MFDEAKVRMIEQRPDVVDPSRKQVVEADHGVAALQKRVAEVGSDEARASGHQNGGRAAGRVDAGLNCHGAAFLILATCMGREAGSWGGFRGRRTAASGGEGFPL